MRRSIQTLARNVDQVEDNSIKSGKGMLNKTSEKTIRKYFCSKGFYWKFGFWLFGRVGLVVVVDSVLPCFLL